MANKIITKIFVYLIVSLVFIVPMNFGSDFVDDFTWGQESQAKKETVSNTCSITPPINVKDSLILSIVTMCLPGVVEKLMEWKEIKCETAVCSYEAVKNNLDPAFCKKQASYKTCKYIMGEIFAMPPLALVEYLRDFIAGILANPVGIVWGVGAKLARNYAEKCGAAGGCSTLAMYPTVLFLTITDALAVYQTLMDMFENGLSMFDFGGESSCDQLSEIREDIEGLVENG